MYLRSMLLVSGKMEAEDRDLDGTLVNQVLKVGLLAR
jgi:hypothetical protein